MVEKFVLGNQKGSSNETKINNNRVNKMNFLHYTGKKLLK